MSETGSIQRKPVSLQEELALMEKAKSNPRHFEPIYDKYFLPVFRFCLSRVADRDLAGEITSLVFSKALQNVRKFKAKGLPVKSWVFQIARNEIAQHYRNLKRQRTVHIEREDFDQFFQAELDPDHGEADQERLESVLAALNDLSPEDLELIELRYFEAHSFKEIADLLTITENSARVRTHRIIQRLKKRLTGRIS